MMPRGDAALKRCATPPTCCLTYRVSCATLLVPIIAFTLTWRSASALRGQATPATRYLVVPFDNANSEARLYWMSEGSAVLLTDDLLALGASAILREDRLRAFERLHVPPVATLSHATVIRLGQLVGASQVIVGAFELRDDVLTVRAREIRLDTGRMQPEVVERGRLASMFDVYAKIARRLVPASRVALEQMEQGHPPLPAFEQYIKGVLAESPRTKLGYLDEALGIFPRFHRARIAQWEVHTGQGEHARALEALRSVPTDASDYRRVRFLAAVSMIHLGQLDAAFTALSELNRTRPDPAVFNNLGIVQLRRPPGSSHGRAVLYFNEASKLDPEDADLFFNLGYAYWLDKEVSAAVHWLREAVRRQPADDEAHYVLGVALQASGSTTEAAREKELARQLSSAWDQVEKQTGGTAMPPGRERVKTEIDVPGSLRLESVLVAAEQREQQQLASFHLDRGRRLFQEERDAEAVAELRRAIYLMPYQADAHLLLGRIYARTGRAREAINALKIAIWIEPANDEARRLLARLSK